MGGGEGRRENRQKVGREREKLEERQNERRQARESGQTFPRDGSREWKGPRLVARDVSSNLASTKWI